MSCALNIIMTIPFRCAEGVKVAGQQIAVCAEQRYVVRADEPAHSRVVIPGLQIIPAGLAVVVIAAVTYPVHGPDVICRIVGNGTYAPGVVGIRGDYVPVGIIYRYDVALKVF